MNAWLKIRLSDISVLITKGTTPTTLGYKFVERGINFIKSESITFDGQIDTSKFAFIDEATHQSLSRSRIAEGDILFSMAGVYLGKTAVVPKEILPANTNQAVGIIRLEQSKAEPRFIDYFIRNKSYNEFLNNLVSQSAQPNFNLTEIRNLPISLPPLAEQHAIASELGALDDKIDLNRRMNETLKAMVQSLFKSWFLNFDPVHSKASGKNPLGLDVATAALFPSRFQDSPLGLVPKGWKVERFDAHITAERGLSYNGEGLRDDCTGLPMHNLNSIYEGGGYKHEGIKYYAGEYREKHLLKPGDMIVANTEQGFEHLLIGHAAIVPKRYGPQGLYSHHIYRVRHKPASPFSPHYLVELFNNPRWHYWISGFSNGTTINMLPKDALEMPLLVVPPAELVQKFTDLAVAIHSQVETNLEQSRTLAALRDALLPKLLSGELRVPQVKQATSEIIPLFAQEPAKPAKKTTDEFVEAVAIAHLTRRLFNGTHPLGRKRCNKLSYLAHRRIEDDVTEHYLKKAAGPYSPWAKYQGPEGIALKRGYVKNGKVGDFTGFLPGDNIAEIDRYVPNYPICAAIDWVVSKFKFKKNDELELLATVDYAALDLLREGEAVSLDGIKNIIATNKEWAAKLKREIFSDANITKALTELRGVFPKTYTA